MNSFKPIGIALAATVLLSLASCNTTPIPDQQPSSDTTVETRQKITIRHYGPGGPAFHVLDIALYWEIIDIILAHGGVPNQENIDNVYDQISH